MGSKRRNTPPETISDLAGGLAHDFNNVLTIMRNCAAFLRDDLPPDDPRQEYVSTMLVAADRAERLTSQLQAFGLTQMLRPEYIKPAEVVRAMSQTLRQIVPEDVDLRIMISAGDVTVLFDPSQLQTAILNLVSWASSRVGGQRRIWITVDEETFSEEGGPIPSGHFVTLIVRKTGEGIDASNKERLFNPKLATGRTAANTDLRLASVYAVVTQGGGHVDVHAEPGQGTQFKLYLPIVDADNVIQLPTKHRASASLDGTEVILVVEDDVNVRRMVREALERHGYTVFEAENGVEALRMIAMFDSPPDLLLTDLVMPQLSGGGLIEALKLQGKLPKILLMSAHTDQAVLQRAAPPDKYPFIKKPFGHQELADRIRDVLDE